MRRTRCDRFPRSLHQHRYRLALRFTFISHLLLQLFSSIAIRITRLPAAMAISGLLPANRQAALERSPPAADLLGVCRQHSRVNARERRTLCFAIRSKQAVHPFSASYQLTMALTRNLSSSGLNCLPCRQLREGDVKLRLESTQRMMGLRMTALRGWSRSSGHDDRAFAGVGCKVGDRLRRRHRLGVVWYCQQ